MRVTFLFVNAVFRMEYSCSCILATNKINSQSAPHYLYSCRNSVVRSVVLRQWQSTESSTPSVRTAKPSSTLIEAASSFTTSGLSSSMTARRVPSSVGGVQVPHLQRILNGKHRLPQLKKYTSRSFFSAALLMVRRSPSLNPPKEQHCPVFRVK